MIRAIEGNGKNKKSLPLRVGSREEVLVIACNQGTLAWSHVFVAVDGVNRENVAAIVEVLDLMNNVALTARVVADISGAGMDVADVAGFRGIGSALRAQGPDGQDR